MARWDPVHLSLSHDVCYCLVFGCQAHTPKERGVAKFWLKSSVRFVYPEELASLVLCFGGNVDKHAI